MSSYYEQAVAVYRSTKNPETKAILGALLHLIEERGPAAVLNPEEVGEREPVWATAAITRMLQEKRGISPEELRMWLKGEGFEVTMNELRVVLWEAVRAGTLIAHSNRYGASFQRA